MITSKNTHSYSYTSAIGAHDHFRLGSVFLFGGAVISLLNAASRTIQSAGNDLIDDHGVLTNFGDYTGDALSLIALWKNASGYAQRLHRRSFTITAPAVVPTAGATYQDSAGNIFTVIAYSALVLETWKSTVVTDTPASGILTKLSGTGDATLTYASWAYNRVVPASYAPAGVITPLGTGGATRYGICAIYALPTDMQTPSTIAPEPSFFALLSRTAYNSNSNAASSIGTGTSPIMTQFHMPAEIEVLEPVLMGFVICDGSDRQIESYTGGGFVNGVRSFKQTPMSSFSAGAVNVANGINVLLDTTGFDGLFSETDTNTQTAMGTIDEFGKVAVLQEDIIPVDFMEDGAVAPDISELYANGVAKLRARKFSGVANQDLYFNWPVPEKIDTTLGIQFAVEYIISEGIAPTVGQTVIFTLAGYSVGNGDVTDQAFGAIKTSSTVHPAGDAQHDRYLTAKSDVITVTNLASVETAILQLVRDAVTGTYVQKVAVTGIRIYWYRLKA